VTVREWVGHCDAGAGPLVVEWGGRNWTLTPLGSRPGLWVHGGTSAIGPLLQLEGISAEGRTDLDAFSSAASQGCSVRGERVEATYAPAGWPGLTVRASWQTSGDDGVDLEVVVELAAEAAGPIRGFEVRVASVLPEPPGSRPRRWVEPRDARAAVLSYDGREPDVTDLTTLPPSPDARLAPRVLPSPWDDGLSYVEMVLPGQVSRRVTESRKVSSLGHTTRYGLFGRDLEPGGVFRARIRGLWLLSSAPQTEALDRAAAFEAEPETGKS
jgi:hypothetical protein